jgi:hypothetical protein
MTGIAAVAACAILGSGLCVAEATKPPVRHAHVYLLRGFLNVFSLGMDELAAKIAQRGINASVHNHTAWTMLASEAAANYRAVARGARFRGTLVNMDLRNRSDVGHIFIDKSGALHQRVLGYVMQAVTRNPEPAPSRAPAAPAAARATGPAPGSPGVTQVTAAPKPAADDSSGTPPAQEPK